MSCPRAGSSSDLLAQPSGPSHPRAAARPSRQSSRVVGHFDADELSLRLEKIKMEQRAHASPKKHPLNTDELAHKLKKVKLEQQQGDGGRHVPREAARQFTRTATSASNLRAQHGEGAPKTAAMRFNQGLPLRAAHVRAQTQAKAPPLAGFNFPFASPQQQAAGNSSSDSTPPPPPPVPDAGYTFQANSGVKPEKPPGVTSKGSWTDLRGRWAPARKEAAAAGKTEKEGKKKKFVSRWRTEGNYISMDPKDSSVCRDEGKTEKRGRGWWLVGDYLERVM